MVTDELSIDTVKLDADTLPTVPQTPPVAGSDRGPVVGEGVGVAEGEAAEEVAATAGDAAQAESPITAPTSTAEPMTLLLVFDRDRRAVPPELLVTDGPGLAFVSCGLTGSESFMMVPPRTSDRYDPKNASRFCGDSAEFVANRLGSARDPPDIVAN
jgi:hypothetical protein